VTSFGKACRLNTELTVTSAAQNENLRLRVLEDNVRLGEVLTQIYADILSDASHNNMMMVYNPANWGI
jgi:hypothetical protein